MRVLVVVASRHGATQEIADELADRLRRSAFDVDLAAPDDVESVDAYGAVLLGSCVYLGRWAASARAFVDRFEPELVTRPLWLFSSGQIGYPGLPKEEPAEIETIATRLRARGHRRFAGRLDTTRLTLAERAAVALLRAPEGDFRDWAEIRAWGDDVAAAIHAEEVRRIRFAR